MSNGHSILDSITNAFVPIHQDGYKFVLAAALATIVLFLLVPPLGWLVAIATAWCAYFFRDPERVTPTEPASLVVPTKAMHGTGADARLPGAGTPPL